MSNRDEINARLLGTIDAATHPWGIKVTRMSDDYTEIDVAMKLTWWNRNIVGTQFGGSLYAMTDPFFMLMLMMQLGKDYIVWDKAATIRFIRPGRGRVRALFRLSHDEAMQIRDMADLNGKTEPVLKVDILDDEDQIVAEVDKTLYVRRKSQSASRKV
ncbi:MAG: tetrameric acyl-CoA thioesterase [Asticcacaulis sp. 32-58-5]|nr:MAG: tetrameric acyl-CoA thioesterase [Asticcacaulis sp. 32-58-5]